MVFALYKTAFTSMVNSSSQRNPLKKRLGQHLLVDKKVLSRIVSSAKLTKNDYVVEVGPGRGALTRELCLKAGRVAAVEADADMIEVLNERLGPFQNLHVIYGDILKVPLGQIIPADVADYKVVANLPYYIASPTIRLFLEADKKPSLMVLTIQKEVADTIVAAPGEMSVLSIAVQLFAEPRIVSLVSPTSFVPPPRVNSAIVHLKVREKVAVDIPDEELFFKIVRAGFSSRRKQLHNSLSNGLGIPSKEALEFLEKAGIHPQSRAQTLSIEDWARLANVFAEAQTTV